VLSLLRVTLLVLLCSSALYADVKISSLFGDGAILQREAKVPVWGWGATGEKVKVQFGQQTKEARVDAEGKWMVSLDPLKADASGKSMVVKVGAETLTIKDVLVGEVWLCSGQSNMSVPMNHYRSKTRQPEYQPLADYIVKETASADDPLLREIRVPTKRSALKPATNFTGEWVKAQVGPIGGISATAYFFARELRKELNVPIGLITSAVGATIIQSWLPKEGYEQNATLKSLYDREKRQIQRKISGWDQKKADANYEKALAKWEVGKNKGRRSRMPTKKRLATIGDDGLTSLYNGMIYPLAPYAIKGVLWYQGESNHKRCNDTHREHFTALVKTWRAKWGQEQLYFFWCQLANFGPMVKEPVEESGWANVCEQLRLSLDLPNSGMAVLNDIGEEKDIHPHNKLDVGKRLSLLALNKAYGQDIVPHGPLYKSSKKVGDKFIVNFSHVGKGLMTGKKTLLEPTQKTDEDLRHFQILDSKGSWYWATAKITSKDTVEVFHKDVKNPVEVRYAWAQNAKAANLYNSVGLPTSVFKTK
jgi:sialate O-acetylesterase